MNLRRTWLHASIAAVLALPLGATQAQQAAFPSKQITLVVPFARGPYTM